MNINEKQEELIIVCGLSGAGKTSALHALEDIGYYCIDRLPIQVTPATVQTLIQRNTNKIALGVELSDEHWLQEALSYWPQVKSLVPNVRVVVLHSAPSVLIARYHESRRPHPLAHTGLTLEQAVSLEHRALRNIPRGVHQIDTSNMTSSQLRKWIQSWAKEEPLRMSVVLYSFGFKYGTPSDMELLYDARFLPNPHYEISLRHKTGNDEEVCTFFKQHPIVEKYIQDIENYVCTWYQYYAQDHRQCLHIAVGCTGGQHRSVYVVNQLKAALHNKNIPVQSRHREELRWPS